jgi:quercetin dioxygenase-like cupin family protein
MKISNSLLPFILLLFSAIAYTTELLSTTTTWEGEQIVYPEGEAQITSVLLKIAEGEVTPFHCHPVPTLGYILKGKIEVETQSGETSVFSEGESVVEVLGTLHRGKALGGPVEIVVFYAGSTAVPNTVLPGDDPDSELCKP